jgi:hypothetical protein
MMPGVVCSNDGTQVLLFSASCEGRMKLKRISAMPMSLHHRIQGQSVGQAELVPGGNQVFKRLDFLSERTLAPGDTIFDLRPVRVNGNRYPGNSGVKQADQSRLVGHPRSVGAEINAPVPLFARKRHDFLDVRIEGRLAAQKADGLGPVFAAPGNLLADVLQPAPAPLFRRRIAVRPEDATVVAGCSQVDVYVLHGVSGFPHIPFYLLWLSCVGFVKWARI